MKASRFFFTVIFVFLGVAMVEPAPALPIIGIVAIAGLVAFGDLILDEVFDAIENRRLQEFPKLLELLELLSKDGRDSYYDKCKEEDYNVWMGAQLHFYIYARPVDEKAMKEGCQPFVMHVNTESLTSKALIKEMIVIPETLTDLEKFKPASINLGVHDLSSIYTAFYLTDPNEKNQNEYDYLLNNCFHFIAYFLKYLNACLTDDGKEFLIEKFSADTYGPVMKDYVLGSGANIEQTLGVPNAPQANYQTIVRNLVEWEAKKYPFLFDADGEEEDTKSSRKVRMTREHTGSSSSKASGKSRKSAACKAKSKSSKKSSGKGSSSKNEGAGDFEELVDVLFEDLACTSLDGDFEDFCKMQAGGVTVNVYAKEGTEEDVAEFCCGIHALDIPSIVQKCPPRGAMKCSDITTVNFGISVVGGGEEWCCTGETLP